MFEVHELNFVKIESSGKKLKARLQAAGPVSGDFMTPPHGERFSKANGVHRKASTFASLTMPKP